MRRSVENVDVTPPPLGFVEVEPIDRHVVSTVSESILDLETNQKTITCDVCTTLTERLLPSLTRLQISCTNPWSSDAWQTFLKDCDAISRLIYKQSKKNVIGENKFL